MSRGSFPIKQGSRGRGTLDLIFDGEAPFDSRITFTRASTGTYVDSAGLIKVASVNQPRIDYNPVTLACKGFLIEEARTNLVTYSEQFDNAAWTKTRSSISANATTAPDGSITADKLVEDSTASNSHFIAGPVVSTVAGTAYSLPVFIKSAERSWVFITGHSSTFGAGVFAFFNAATGAVGATAGCTATCTPVGNGWFRASITANATVTGSQVAYQLNLTTGDATYTHTGDGTSGLFIWGAQLEAGAFATSYIPTVASQVTRAADVATITGANFVSWYNRTEGTFALEMDGLTTSGIAMCATRGAGYGPRLQINTPNQPQINNINDSSVLDATLTSAAVIGLNTFSKSAFAYKINDYALSVNGNTVLTDTSASVPTAIVDLKIGCDPVNTTQLNGHIKRLTYYPTRLTNTQLQEFSAL